MTAKESAMSLEAVVTFCVFAYGSPPIAPLPVSGHAHQRHGSGSSAVKTFGVTPEVV